MPCLKLHRLHPQSPEEGRHGTGAGYQRQPLGPGVEPGLQDQPKAPRAHGFWLYLRRRVHEVHLPDAAL